MRILYIFPHPDDESFGPSLAISQQRRAGHEVFLLTLTKGGATKLRHKFGHSVEEMGEVRQKEMQEVARVLDPTDLTVLHIPDSWLKELEPRETDDQIREYIGQVRPNVVVPYAVHGISGFPDHLVTHAVVKRVFVALRDGGASTRRLAFFTVDEAFASGVGGPHSLKFSMPEDIDCVLEYDDVDVETFQKALDCYVTYQEMIDKTGVRRSVGRRGHFEIFGEEHDPPLSDLCHFD